MNDPLVHAIEERVRSLGSDFDPQVLAATQDIYRPHVDPHPVAELQDLAYGPHERHRLDVYAPAARPLGILVYVHGGGFVRGEKNGDGVFYPNVGRFLARAGFVAVLPNYRRAPEWGWPCGARDVQAVIEWIARERSLLGCGAGTPLFVMGQSAGASHVASWLFDQEARGADLPGLAGVLMMSGFYKAEAPLAPNIAAYFGADAALYPRRSPLAHVRETTVPIWLSVAELDPGRIAAHTFELAHALTLRNRRGPEFAWFRGHNHVSTVLSLGSPQPDVGGEVLRFLRGHLRDSVAL